MVKDKSRLLVKRTYLEEELKDVAEMEGIDVQSMSSFDRDPEYSHFFEVLRGSCIAATTWREDENSDEVTAVFTLKSGDGVLFLPGEPFLIKFQEAEVSEFILGKNV